jgi:hypothetical protein
VPCPPLSLPCGSGARDVVCVCVCVYVCVCVGGWVGGWMCRVKEDAVLHPLYDSQAYGLTVLGNFILQ